MGASLREDNTTTEGEESVSIFEDRRAPVVFAGPAAATRMADRGARGQGRSGRGQPAPAPTPARRGPVTGARAARAACTASAARSGVMASKQR
jgi:hypothetical protein